MKFTRLNYNNTYSITPDQSKFFKKSFFLLKIYFFIYFGSFRCVDFKNKKHYFNAFRHEKIL
jgi:hypothetical protein